MPENALVDRLEMGICEVLSYLRNYIETIMKFFFEYIMWKFFLLDSNIVWAHLIPSTPGRPQFFQYAIVICISNSYAEVLKKDTVFPFRTPSTNWYSAHSSMCCRIKDQLFQMPTHLRFSSELFWLAGIYEPHRQIKYLAEVYQNAWCSMMCQIIPFHKGSIIIICRHTHILNERLFLVLIVDRMSERKMW